MWHPASLLLTWLCFVLGLSWMPLPPLLLVSLASLVLAVIVAPERSCNLLWRTRWLLLSLGVLFLFFTPGEYLPGMAGKIGLTFEGLQQCAEQISRLLAMLASLALLHQQIGNQGLLVGLYWLLRPLPWREVTVVRLMLVLEFIEQRGRIDWREWLTPEHEMPAVASLHLRMPLVRNRDIALMGLLLVAVLGVAISA